MSGVGLEVVECVYRGLVVEADSWFEEAAGEGVE